MTEKLGGKINMPNLRNVKFLKSYGLSTQLDFSDRPEIVFSGRSNVGKSTLINSLCGQKNLARVSSSPGKTATINFFEADGFYLVDLPGYGYAKRSDDEKKRWAELVEGYFSQDRNISLVVQLVDSRRDLTDDDADMINFLIDGGYNFIAVLTKWDKLNKTEQTEAEERFSKSLPGIKSIPFSSIKKIGTDETIREIIKAVKK
jgi:GTP-binding protein